VTAAPDGPGSTADGGDLELEVRLERMLFHQERPEGLFGVARVRMRGHPPFVAVGPLPAVDSGQRLRLHGRWVDHPRHGKQFAAEAALPILPKSAQGIEGFLASGLVRGVGPVLAKRIVRAFGETTLETLDREPEKVAAIPGIGPKRAAAIRHSLVEQRRVQELLVFLRGHDIGVGTALRIHRSWGDQAIQRLQENPWRLAAEISGIGFRTTDAIAQRLGLPATSIHRAAAGLLHVLGEASSSGHALLARSALLEAATALLTPADQAPDSSSSRLPLDEALESLQAARRVVVEAEGVYLSRLHQAEVDLSRRLRQRLELPPRPLPDQLDQDLEAFERRARIALAPQQRDAVRAAFRDRLVVITGGPGTGKTTLVRAIVALATRDGRRLALAAPTGRAAKRLSDAASLDAKTLHRLLEVEPATGRFQRDEGNPLELDLLLVDEASMIDLPLAASLTAALPPQATLVLVGDIDQLPSVGPGQVLGDLIACPSVAVVRLSHIFRQGGGSRIVEGAHRILRGLLPESATSLDEPGADYFFVARDEPENARTTIETLVAERIPARFGFDPLADIQVLAPMHRGELGTAGLNQLLQQRLNPSGAPVPAGRGLRVGDRVLQTRNNYELQIFNGDLGRVLGHDAEEGVLRVDFDGREVEIEAQDLEDLTLAYCCSVHKSQGSEYPCVVLALHTQHYVMLQRNLLYTAITRGRRLVVVVGNRRALALAVRNATASRRNSRLLERLKGES
jgi:exodeoxyribonuclease V alpha subunit